MHCLAERRPSPILRSTPTDIRQAGQPQHLAHYHFINHTGARARTPFRDEEIGNRPGARLGPNLATNRAGLLRQKPALTGGGRDMMACSELAGEVRARALYGHPTAALFARVVVLVLALLLALVLTSQSRADDGSPDEPPLPFTIGGGLTVAALGVVTLVMRRIQNLRGEKRRLEER